MSFNPTYIHALLDDVASNMARLLGGQNTPWSQHGGATFLIEGLGSEPTLSFQGFEITAESQHERLMQQSIQTDCLHDFLLLAREITSSFSALASDTLRITLFIPLIFRVEHRAQMTINGLHLGGSNANRPLPELVEKLAAAHETMAPITCPGLHAYQVMGHSVPVHARSREDALRIFAAITFPDLMQPSKTDPEAYNLVLSRVRDHPFATSQKELAR